MIQYQTKSFDNLGGEQTQKALTAFEDNEAVAARNGHFDTVGSFTKRKGGEKRNTTAFGASVDGLYNFIHAGDTVSDLIISAGAVVYKNTSATSIFTGLTAAAIPAFTTLNDYLFMVNENDAAKQYSVTTGGQNWGIVRPTDTTVATTANTGAGALAAGDYLIRVTYVNDTDSNVLSESNPSDVITHTISGGDAPADIDLTVIPVSSDAQVTDRYIYMSNVGGAVLSYQGAIGNNTATTYTINAASSGALLEYDHDVPTSGLKDIAVWRGRIWGIDGDTIYHTKPSNHNYMPQGDLDQEADVRLQVADGTEELKAIGIVNDKLLILTKYSVWAITGYDEASFQAYRVSSDQRIGCWATHSVASYGGFCYFAGQESIYRTDGNSIQNVGLPIRDHFSPASASSDFRVNVPQLSDARGQCVSVAPYTWYMLAVPLGSSTVNDGMFVMDLDTGNWSPWNGFYTQSLTVLRDSGRDIWLRGDKNGYIWDMESLDGDGSDITSTSTGSNTSTTLNDTAQSWTVNLYAGCNVCIISGTGVGQVRDISSNTATELTVSAAWDDIPDDTSIYAIGGIKYRYQHKWDHYGNPSVSKRCRWVRPRFDTTGSYDVDVGFGYDFSDTSLDTVQVSLPPQALWDVAMWDTSTWDGQSIVDERVALPHSRIHRWSSLSIQQYAAGQPIKTNGYDKIFQFKGIR